MKYLIIIITVFLTIGCNKVANLSVDMNETLYVSRNNADMPAFVRGNGESNVFILVLHGGPGGNGLEYRTGTYAKMLEEKYAMVYWDQRHQGNAHGHLKQDDVSIDEMVEDTHLLIRTLKKRYGEGISVFLLGHSWGGTLGTAYMIKENYQHELKGWIEVDGAHDIPKLNTELVKMIQDIGGAEILAGNNVDQWNEMITFVNGLDTLNISSDESGTLNGYGHTIEGLLNQIAAGEESSESLMKYLFFSPNNPMSTGISGNTLPNKFQEEVEAKAMTADLHKITIPTLLQWGKYDFVVPPALGYSAFNEISSTNKYLKIYNSSAHSPMNNEPVEFAQDIIDFVELYK